MKFFLTRKSIYLYMQLCAKLSNELGVSQNQVAVSNELGASESQVQSGLLTGDTKIQ